MRREITFRLPSVGRILIEFLDGRDDPRLPPDTTETRALTEALRSDAWRKSHLFFTLHPECLSGQRSTRASALLDRARRVFPIIDTHPGSCITCIARRVEAFRAEHVLRDMRREREQLVALGMRLGALPREEICALVGELVRLGLPEDEGAFMLGGVADRGPIIVQSFERI